MTLRRSAAWLRSLRPPQLEPLDPEGVPYPERIGATLTLRTGDALPLVAVRRHRDTAGIMQYAVQTLDGADRLPVTEAEYLAGGYTLRFDLIPGMSAMRFAFRLEGETR